jgi:hypothetical protein
MIVRGKITCAPTVTSISVAIALLLPAVVNVQQGTATNAMAMEGMKIASA